MSSKTKVKRGRRKAGDLPKLCIKKGRTRKDGMSGDLFWASFNKTKQWFGPTVDRQTGESRRAEAQQQLDEFTNLWLANGRQRIEQDDTGGLTVAELLDRYLRDLEDEIGERASYRSKLACEVLKSHYGSILVEDFSPKRLKTVRDSMIIGGKKSRATINERLAAMRRAFGWAVSEDMISPSALAAFETVKPIKKEVGRRKGLREPKKLNPVPEADAFATIAEMRPQPAAIAELVWWTGARPKEIRDLCPVHIDRSSTPWVARLREHKNAHRGQEREVDFGPEAREILAPYLDRCPLPAPDSPIFNPQDAMKELSNERRDKRETPLWPSHDREAREVRRRARGVEPRKLGDQYTASAFRLAIERAVERVNVKRQNAGEKPITIWKPYQLRHSALTRIRKGHGKEAAQAIAGHEELMTIGGYTRQAVRELQREIAEQAS